MLTVNESAVLIGSIMLLISIPILTHRKHALKALLALISSEPTARLSGVFGFLIALSILSTGAHLEVSVPGLITLIGWIFLIKGVWLVWNPSHAFRLAKRYYKSDMLVTFFSAVNAIVGTWLVWFGLEL